MAGLFSLKKQKLFFVQYHQQFSCCLTDLPNNSLQFVCFSTQLSVCWKAEHSHDQQTVRASHSACFNTQRVTVHWGWQPMWSICPVCSVLYSPLIKQLKIEQSINKIWLKKDVLLLYSVETETLTLHYSSEHWHLHAAHNAQIYIFLRFQQLWRKYSVFIF